MNGFREYSTGELVRALNKVSAHGMAGNGQTIGVTLAELFEACAERLVSLENGESRVRIALPGGEG